MRYQRPSQRQQNGVHCQRSAPLGSLRSVAVSSFLVWQIIARDDINSDDLDSPSRHSQARVRCPVPGAKKKGKNDSVAVSPESRGQFRPYKD